MAIKSIKEIIQNKAYMITAEDRKIFEQDDMPSFFGFSKNDVIEFLLYDVSDNLLPQKGGVYVRYIPITTENINDYFLIPEGTLFQKYNLPKEYFIDAERLIREAGYQNGTYKTQITLLNKRVGSNTLNDKLWISEISPSRTEVRLYPNDKGIKINPELKQRFDLMINGGEFRDDMTRYVSAFAEKVNPSVISEYLKYKYGNDWFNNARTEYKIQDFESFVTKIYNKFLESLLYEVTGRISDVNDLNYGKPNPKPLSLSFNKEDVKFISEKLIVNCLNKFLLLPNVNYGSKTVTKDESLDEVVNITQTKELDLTIDTNPPVSKIVAKKLLVKKDVDLTLIKQIDEIKKELPIDSPPILSDSILTVKQRPPKDFNYFDDKIEMNRIDINEDGGILRPNMNRAQASIGNAINDGPVKQRKGGLFKNAKQKIEEQKERKTLAGKGLGILGVKKGEGVIGNLKNSVFNPVKGFDAVTKLGTSLFKRKKKGDKNTLD